MKIFLDTANVAEIREAASRGTLDGVTTNPTLLAKEAQAAGRDPRLILKEICSLVEGPVNAEVVATEAEPMIREAYELAEIADHIVVKLPMTVEGVKAVRQLARERIATNVTLVFTPTQALLAAKAGASYVSPFVGRLDDRSEDGMDVAQQIIQVYDSYHFTTEVLVASVRHPRHVVEAALMGADIATMPFAIFEKLYEHPLTELGLKQFLADWEKLQQPQGPGRRTRS